MTYNTGTENTFLIENNLPFRAESRNLNPVSIFLPTWYNMLYLFYADFVSSHQSEEFLLLLPPNSYFSTTAEGYTEKVLAYYSD